MSLLPIRFCPYCGTSTRKQKFAGKERPVCPNCGWVYFPDPKVGVAVIVVQDQKILLVRRRNKPYQGKWALPAGFLDLHEDPVEAAQRECLEETGLEVRIRALLDVFSAREHERGADIMIAYCAEVIGGKLQPGDDADDAQYFPVSDLPPLAFMSTLKAIQTWVNAPACKEGTG